MIEAGEQRLIEQFVTHPPLKTLNKRVMDWLSLPIDFGAPTPFEHSIRGQLSSIVADYHAGLAAHGNQVGQFADQSFARDRGIMT